MMMFLVNSSGLLKYKNNTKNLRNSHNFCDHFYYLHIKRKNKKLFLQSREELNNSISKTTQRQISSSAQKLDLVGMHLYFCGLKFKIAHLQKCWPFLSTPAPPPP